MGAIKNVIKPSAATFAILILFSIAFLSLIGAPRFTKDFQVVPFKTNKQVACNTSKKVGYVVNSKSPTHTLNVKTLTSDLQLKIKKLNDKIKKLTADDKNRKKLSSQVASLKLQISEVNICRKGSLYVEPKAESVCGNGVLEAGEVCDPMVPGNQICCTSSCTSKEVGSNCQTGQSPLTQCEQSVCNNNGACIVQNKEGNCDDGQNCTIEDHCVAKSCIGRSQTAEESKYLKCGIGACEREIIACETNAFCVPGSPSSEVCNGLDDDCDDLIDEDLGTLQCGTGQCSNQVPVCINGVQQTCESKHASAEICNGLDDDCDGEVDEGIAPISCGTGACTNSVTACVNGKIGSCLPLSASIETCNSIDDDCDGITDEGFGVENCGVGICARSVNTCVAGHLNVCTPGQPLYEICNGADDDCDGDTDEGLGMKTCGKGACSRSIPECANGFITTCVPGLPSTEICNNIDDDCDGQIDEGMVNVSCGLGQCRNTVPACISGNTNICEPLSNSYERCDGLDNDCDGITDNGSNLCPSQPGAFATCSSAACKYKCLAGFADADKNLSDGCEIDLMNDEDNCGTVGNECYDSSCGSALCQSGVCTTIHLPAGIQCDQIYFEQCVEDGYGHFTGQVILPGPYYCDGTGNCKYNYKTCTPWQSCSSCLGYWF